MSASEGKKILRLTGVFLVICGIVTLIIAIVAISNAGKTGDMISDVKAQTAARNSTTSSVSSMDSYEVMEEWQGKARYYAIIMLAVSIAHIVAGIIGVILADSPSGGMICLILGGVLLVLAAVVIIYPLMNNKKDYDAAQTLMDAILPMLNQMGGTNYVFKLISMQPFKHVITYSSIALGGMYTWGAFMLKSSPASSPAPSRQPFASTGVSDDFFEQFNKPPVPQQQRPMGAPQQGMPQQQRPMGAPQQGMPQQQRPMGAPQQGMPQQQRPMGAPQQGMSQQQRPMGAPQQGMPQQQRPMGAPPQGMPQQGAPQQAPQQAQYRPTPHTSPTPNLRPAPGVKPPAPPPESDSSGTMDEVALPSADELEKLLGGMSGQK